MFARLAILGHEAAHRLLFRSRSANDLVGRWLLDYPAFVPFDVYRRSHFAHHREEFGPGEPDIPLYAGYPIPASSWRRKLLARPVASPAGRTWCRWPGAGLDPPDPSRRGSSASQVLLWAGHLGAHRALVALPGGLAGCRG
jgi:hypothetical protein